MDRSPNRTNGNGWLACGALSIAILTACSNRTEAAITFYGLGKRVFYRQTSDSQPTTLIFIDGGVELFTDDPGDLALARVFSTNPAAFSPASPFVLTQDPPGRWFSYQAYPSLEALDVDLPPGDTFGYLIENGGLGAQLALVPIPSANRFPNDVPYFTNNAFTQLNGMDPTDPFLLTWNAFTAPPEVNDLPIFLSIYRISDGHLAVGTSFPNSVTSLNIPADTFAPNTAYRADLYFSARNSLPNAGFASATRFANYDFATSMDFTTAAGGAGGSLDVPEPGGVAFLLVTLLVVSACRRRPPRRCLVLACLFAMVGSMATPQARADVGIYALLKLQAFVQSSDLAPVSPVSIEGALDVLADPGDLTSARVFSTQVMNPSPGSPFTLSETQPMSGHWFLRQPYASLEALNADFPPGDTFGYAIEGGTLGAQLALAPIPANLFPFAIPYFTNNAFSALNGMDTTAPFTLTWNGYTAPAEANDLPTFLTIFRVSDGQVAISTAGDNTLSSLVIPAGTLAPNTVYRADVAQSARNLTLNAGFTSASRFINHDYLTTLQFTTSPILPGDYNRDGRVDAADYVAWRKNDGTQIGYVTWRTHFGEPAGNGSGATANSTAPEPTTLVPLIAAAVGIRLRRRQIA